MPNQNNLCPCGSGLQKIKCCAPLKLAPASPALSKIALEPSADCKDSKALSFANLIALEIGSDLPFMPIAKEHDLVEAALNYLEEDALEHHSIHIDFANHIYVSLIFRDPIESGDYHDLYGDFYDDLFADGADEESEDVIEVLWREEIPGGPLKIEVFRNQKSQPTTQYALQINAGLIFIWLALAKSVDRKKLPSATRDFHAEFKNLPKKQKALAAQKFQLHEELKTLSLVSMSLSFEAILADEQSLKSLVPDFRLPELLAFPKPKAAKISPAEFIDAESTRTPLNANLSDIFLTQAEAQQVSYWPNSSELRRLSECIGYYFSDGVFVHAGQILTTKYALLLPPDLLPGEWLLPEGETFWQKQFSAKPTAILSSQLSEKLPEIDLLSPERGGGFYRHPEILKVNNSMLELMQRLAKRANAGELKVDLKWFDDSSNTCLRLAKIELVEPAPFQWQASYFARHLKEHPEFALITGQFNLQKDEAPKSQMLALKNGFLDLQTRTLWLQPLAKYLQTCQSHRYHTSEELNFSRRDTVRCESSTWPEFKLHITAEGPTSFAALKHSLQLYSYFSFLDDRIAVPASSRRILRATSELHLDASGRFFLIRRLQSESEAQTIAYPFLNGFSYTTLKLLKSLGEGFVGHFNCEAKELASRSSQKRDFELKLLKHLGVFNLLVFEALAVRFQGALSDGTLVKRASDILPALESKLLALLGESALGNFQEHCSKQVYSKLKQFMSELNQIIKSEADDSHQRVLLTEGEFILPSLFEDELRLLFTVMSHAAVVSNGEIFAKPRLNFLTKIFLFDERRLNESNILNTRTRIAFADRPKNWVFFQLPYSRGASLVAILAAFQPLLKANFEFYLKGQRLQELLTSEFHTELNLSENLAEVGSGSLSGPINWFELHPKFFLHGVEISSQQAGPLLHDGIIEHAGRFYLIPASRLPSLKRLSHFWVGLQRGKKLSNGISFGQQVFQVPKSQVLTMLALRSSGISVIGSKRWQQICHFYDGLGSEHAPLTLPPTIHAELKAYQKIGVQWLYELSQLGLGAVLADDMGLGKTLQTLAFLEKLREEKQMGSVLIVVPTSLTYNWLSEKDKFVPQLPMQAFSAKDKNESLKFLQTNPQSVVLTTYGMMHEHKEFFQKINWHIIIFDEAQNLKTITAQRTTTARALNSQIKICLTGTPLENHLGEFYSILDLAVPGCLGDVDEFRKIFVHPPSIATDDLNYLKLTAKPLVLRRTKQQILSELPEKNESRVALDFEDKQKKIYRDIAISYNQKIQEAITSQGESKCQLQMLTALLRLRQACSDPSALPGITYSKTPPKLEALQEALIEIVEAGQSALVFTQFIRTLERTEALLKEAALPTYVIHGGVSQSQREKILREFNECPGGAVLVMTLKTGGVGLNLAKASYVFHLEPWWNPAVENQATDRAHRMGQRRAVQVYRYIMHESVEEKIEVLKGRKQQTFSAVFGDSENIDSTSLTNPHSNRIESTGGFLSKEDFNFLLSTNGEKRS